MFSSLGTRLAMMPMIVMQMIPQIQILTTLIACDTDHDDDLSFCLITLDADTLKMILDVHSRWQKEFPDALEITLEDRERWAQFLSDDEEEKLDAMLTDYRNDQIRLITEPSEFIDITEAENLSAAWRLNWRKIVISEDSIRFVGVYENSPILHNAFTASPLIPLDTFKEALTAIQEGEKA